MSPHSPGCYAANLDGAAVVPSAGLGNHRMRRALGLARLRARPKHGGLGGPGESFPRSFPLLQSWTQLSISFLSFEVNGAGNLPGFVKLSRIRFRSAYRRKNPTVCHIGKMMRSDALGHHNCRQGTQGMSCHLSSGQSLQNNSHMNCT